MAVAQDFLFIYWMTAFNNDGAETLLSINFVRMDGLGGGRGVGWLRAYDETHSVGLRHQGGMSLGTGFLGGESGYKCGDTLCGRSNQYLDNRGINTNIPGEKVGGNDTK